MLSSPWALAESPRISMTVGADFSSGKYGDAQRTDTWAFPLSLKMESEDLTYKLSVPWIHTRGPSNVVGSGADRVVTGLPAGRTRTEDGWGDVVGAVTYDLFQDRDSRRGVDVTGKIKLATGDTRKGLGTGHNDYAIQADGYQGWGNINLLGTLGWKKMGDPGGVDYRDPWYASMGASHQWSSQTSWGALYDWRQKITAHGSPVREVTAFLSQRIDRQLKFQVYLVHGYSDASADYGGGLTLTYGF